jgi:hypothetical protein
VTDKLATLLLVAVFGLFLGACGSDSNDVPSLGATPTPGVEKPLDDEAKVMAFAQCMRDQGIEFKDPVVDAEGNMQAPEPVEGVILTRKGLAAPYEASALFWIAMIPELREHFRLRKDGRLPDEQIVADFVGMGSVYRLLERLSLSSLPVKRMIN